MVAVDGTGAGMVVKRMIAGLIVVCAIAVASQALAQSRRAPAPAQRPLVERELSVANRARKPAVELYVSPNDAPDWGEERLAGAVVAPGRVFRAKLGRTRMCLFDVQFLYADGSREELHDLDVCRTSQVAFDGSTATDVPVGTPHPVALVNNATRPIQQVFLSEAETAQWGDDRVTTRGVSVGDRLDIPYRGGCAVDLRVVFDNRAAEERRGLDICTTPALSIEPGWTTADAPPVPRPPSPPVSPPMSAPMSAPVPVVAAKPADIVQTEVRVTNDSGADVTQIYLYPEGEADQGTDLLGTGVLRDGLSKSVSLARGASCRFSAHLVFAGHVADRDLHGLELCANAAVTVGR